MRDEELVGTIARTSVSKNVRGTIARIEYQFLPNNNWKNDNACKVKIRGWPVSYFRCGSGVDFGMHVSPTNHRYKPRR
ncbi:MAG: hypothetical protein IH987_22545 [Planctomycetes bacterium]|nr:hypothetical protein [Planctomycetota bacterium]